MNLIYNVKKFITIILLSTDDEKTEALFNKLYDIVKDVSNQGFVVLVDLILTVVK